jgi:diaminopimelate epimerase
MADPAGNRTAFITDPVPARLHAALGAAIVADEELDAEQAGFITMPGPGHPGHLQMSGGEFCGNASRSFGYLIGREWQMQAGETVIITVSGAGEPLQVTLEEEGAEACMPLPEKTGHIPIPGAGTFPFVEFSGITHLILEDRETDPGLADRIIDHLRKYTAWQAIGVMFLQGESLRPYVWVRELETRVWERSCGSGTLACSVWKSRLEQDGMFRLELTEPGGRLYASVIRREGRIAEAGIGGPVRLEKPVIRTYHLNPDA